jgi:hypothetical protein
MALPVFYAGWQYECCGDPFRVGDQVAGPLKVSFGGERWMPADWTVLAELQPHATANSAAVRVDELVAHTEQSLHEARGERVIFHEEHHGGIRIASRQQRVLSAASGSPAWCSAAAKRFRGPRHCATSTRYPMFSTPNPAMSTAAKSGCWSISSPALRLLLRGRRDTRRGSTLTAARCRKR